MTYESIMAGTGWEGVLDTELRTFQSLLPKLLKTDRGRWALIKDTRFVAAYDTEWDAVSVGYSEFGNVPFLTKQILEL